MRVVGRIAFMAGIVAIVVGVYSRLSLVPVNGIQSHAIMQFAEVCLLLAIAGFLWERS